MAQSYISIHLHIIFSTKNRWPWIKGDVLKRLCGYLGSVAKDRNCVVHAIGGASDHVHMLLSPSPQITIPNLVRDLKANSSRWIHETISNAEKFAWQSGYGAFSVSASNLDQVQDYVNRQKEHPRKRSFQEEWLVLLEKHGLIEQD